MTDIFENFRFEFDGVTTLVDALCGYIKDEITFGRIKGGEKLPTINAIAKATGLTFGQARTVTERLAKEGYVHCRPRCGTFVLSRTRNALRGRVLVAYPDVDICRFYPTQLFDTINRRLTAANYAVSVASFPIDADGNIAQFKSQLHRATDLVIAMRATPKLQKCLVKSGVKRIYAYGCKPSFDEECPWVRFNFEEALERFAAHCEKVGVKHVVQVCFEGNEELDAAPALAAKGIESSWLTVSRKDVVGRGRFDGIVQCAFETFANMPRSDIPDLLLFWNAFAAQGAFMAFLSRGIRTPEDVKVVSLSSKGFGPICTKPITRFEVDPVDDGEKISDYALSILTKGRAPNPPKIAPQYVFGATFPFGIGDAQGSL